MSGPLLRDKSPPTRMSFRTAVAGPSRLPALVFRPSSRTRPQAAYNASRVSSTPILRRAAPPPCPVHGQVRHLHFPDPRTDRPPENTHFFIRTNERIASPVHALAIVKAAEQHLGRVLEMDFQKDPHTGQYTSQVWISLYRPYNVARSQRLPIHVEIPAPELETSVEDMLCGGPSLADIDRAWSDDPPEPSGTAGGKPLRKDGGSIRFSIHHAKKREAPTSDAKARFADRRGEGGQDTRTKQEKLDDNYILRALEKVGKGPYGGFEGIYDQLKHLRTDLEPAQPDQADGGGKPKKGSNRKTWEEKLRLQQASAEQKRRKAQELAKAPAAESGEPVDPASVWKRKRPTPHARQKRRERSAADAGQAGPSRA